MTADHKNTLIVLDCSAFGPNAKGKNLSDWFFPQFRRVLDRSGIQVSRQSFETFRMSDLSVNEPTAILLNYNEDFDVEKVEHWNKVCDLYDELISGGWERRVLHPPKLGEVLGDKRETLRVLAPTGYVQRDIGGGIASQAVFSVAPTGTQEATQVIAPGAALDPARLNTPLVNTLYSYRGVSYQVALRAIAVGRICVGISLRARPAAEGDPNVHTMDTPRDVDLLNYLYGTIVLPRRSEILKMCTSISEILGLGFFAHDVLPCAESGRLVLCESGYKFDDPLMRRHFSGIPELVFRQELGAVSRDMSAMAFCSEALRLRVFE